GVLVVRLERVGERTDRGDERALALQVVLGAFDRKLRLMGKAREQTHLAIVELAVVDNGGKRADPACVQMERRDAEAPGALGQHTRDLRDGVAPEDERLGPREPLVRELRRKPGRRRPVPDVRLDDELVGGILLLCPERRARGAERASGHLDTAREDLLARLRRRELAARLEQRVRNLRRLELPRVEASLAQRNRR